jgi:hypothetical protein
MPKIYVLKDHPARSASKKQVKRINKKHIYSDAIMPGELYGYLDGLKFIRDTWGLSEWKNHLTLRQLRKPVTRVLTLMDRQLANDGTKYHPEGLRIWMLEDRNPDRIARTKKEHDINWEVRSCFKVITSSEWEDKRAIEHEKEMARHSRTIQKADEPTTLMDWMTPDARMGAEKRLGDLGVYQRLSNGSIEELLDEKLGPINANVDELKALIKDLLLAPHRELIE